MSSNLTESALLHINPDTAPPRRSGTAIALASGGMNHRERIVLRPTESLALPEGPRHLKTMLSAQELELLYTLARDRYTGRGEIIDGGAFLGGSTVALACGLRDNPGVFDKQGRVHSYDTFVSDSFVAKYIDGYPNGTSTRPYYDSMIADVASCVSVHEGDIAASSWPIDRPIEILFIDVAKSWEINDFLLRQFFPRLIPGMSTVIQQDYHWPHTPWIAITMELLADHVTYLGKTPGNTASYRWERAIEPGQIPPRLLELGETRLRELANRAQRFERGGRDWTAQQCNLVSLSMALGRRAEAAAIFEATVNAAPTWIEHFHIRPTLAVRA
jgi:hypothetical protein